jgi:hypothetical protein
MLLNQGNQKAKKIRKERIHSENDCDFLFWFNCCTFFTFRVLVLCFNPNDDVYLPERQKQSQK